LAFASLGGQASCFESSVILQLHNATRRNRITHSINIVKFGRCYLHPVVPPSRKQLWFIDTAFAHFWAALEGIRPAFIVKFHTCTPWRMRKFLSLSSPKLAQLATFVIKPTNRISARRHQRPSLWDCSKNGLQLHKSLERI
jgi:hypothetical protein